MKDGEDPGGGDIYAGTKWTDPPPEELEESITITKKDYIELVNKEEDIGEITYEPMEIEAHSIDSSFIDVKSELSLIDDHAYCLTSKCNMNSNDATLINIESVKLEFDHDLNIDKSISPSCSYETTFAPKMNEVLSYETKYEHKLIERLEHSTALEKSTVSPAKHKSKLADEKCQIFLCQFCDKQISFKSGNKIINHIARHSMNRNVGFLINCIICNAEFKYEYMLLRHLNLCALPMIRYYSSERKISLPSLEENVDETAATDCVSNQTIIETTTSSSALQNNTLGTNKFVSDETLSLKKPDSRCVAPLENIIQAIVHDSNNILSDDSLSSKEPENCCEIPQDNIIETIVYDSVHEQNNVECEVVFPKINVQNIIDKSRFNFSTSKNLSNIKIKSNNAVSKESIISKPSALTSVRKSVNSSLPINTRMQIISVKKYTINKNKDDAISNKNVSNKNDSINSSNPITNETEVSDKKSYKPGENDSNKSCNLNKNVIEENVYNNFSHVDNISLSSSHDKDELDNSPFNIPIEKHALKTSDNKNTKLSIISSDKHNIKASTSKKHNVKTSASKSSRVTNTKNNSKLSSNIKGKIVCLICSLKLKKLKLINHLVRNHSDFFLYRKKVEAISLPQAKKRTHAEILNGRLKKNLLLYYKVDKINGDKEITSSDYQILSDIINLISDYEYSDDDVYQSF